MENASKLLEIYDLIQFKATQACEFEYLVQPKLCLIDCTYSIKGKSIYFDYDLKRCKNIKQLKRKDYDFFILNLVYFVYYYESYIVDFSEENIYYDINFVPKFLKRDVSYTKIDYLSEIKSLILYLYDQKDDLAHYKMTGHLYTYQNEFLNRVVAIETIEELYETILQERSLHHR